MKIYKDDKTKRGCVLATLKEYHATEANELVYTHKQETETKMIYFLKSYGLTSWSIEAEKEEIVEGLKQTQ